MLLPRFSLDMGQASEALPSFKMIEQKKGMKTINELFASAANRFPERPALLELTTAPGERELRVITLTYALLQQRVHQFAGVLQEQGVVKGNRVVIWSSSQGNWMVAYLAVLLVGAVVVPLDIHTLEETLHAITQASAAVFLITTQKHYQQLKEPPLPLIDIAHLPAGTFHRDQLPPIGGDDLAALVFTSGTTGQPKGVMLSHRNITSDALAALSVIGVHTEDRALSILPLNHMFETTIEIALLSQGASVLYAHSLRPNTLLRLLETQNITCMVVVPQVLDLFMRELEREVRQQGRRAIFDLLLFTASCLPFSWRPQLFRRIHRRFGHQFRFFISGGAALAPDLARRWEKMGLRVLQGYGATECAPIITATPVRRRKYGTVGKPLPGLQVRIADDGEIQVNGPNVALGYWNDPEATKAAFKDGWYATGDLGFLDTQGFLVLQGRKQHVIVLANGLNVFPEEIEQVLLTDSLIKDVAVIGLPKGQNELALYAVVLMDDPTQARTAIRQANKYLAPHQRVHGLIIWPDPDFPRTPTTQKIKRSTLMERLLTLQKQGMASLSPVIL